jgi:uncharacterized protein (TIGR03086 family)
MSASAVSDAADPAAGPGLDPLTAHARGQDLFGRALAGIRPEQLGAPSPCAGWTVLDVIGHVVGGNLAVADLQPATADVLAAFRPSAERAAAAFAQPGVPERVFNLAAGAIPGSVLLLMRTTDVVVHAWDIARATGQPSDLDPELASVVLGYAHRLVQPQFRGPGRPFAYQKPVAADAGTADRLAAFVGRDPNWAPARSD